jgi:hypothetical protein
LVLERRSRNRLNIDTTRKKLKKIAASASRNKALGFEGRVGKLVDPQVIMDEETRNEVNRYLVRLRLEKAVVRSPEAAQNQFRHVLSVVSRCAQSEGWRVLEMTEQDRDGQDTSFLLPTRSNRPDFVVPTLTADALSSYFGGIYERDEHIRIIHDAVSSYVSTLAAWRRDNSVEVARSHILLKGKPAGAKTTVLERLKRWYEDVSPGADRITFIDMLSATKAGLENWLLERAEEGDLADIIVLEEIEKQQPLDNLLPLVSLMGSGHIAKLNARVGRRRELANVLVLATCNDEALIRRWRNGALWSRFSKKLHCARPSPQLMRRILLDTVQRVGGNPAWVDRAMEFAYEILPQVTGVVMDDPREIKGILDGRDRLLDGSYQLDLLSIMRREKDEARADRQRERVKPN